MGTKIKSKPGWIRDGGFQYSKFSSWIAKKCKKNNTTLKCIPSFLSNVYHHLYSFLVIPAFEVVVPSQSNLEIVNPEIFQRDFPSVSYEYLWILASYFPLDIWLVSTPLKNMKVSWDDEIPNTWKSNKCSNHQPDKCRYIPKKGWFTRGFPPNLKWIGCAPIYSIHWTLETSRAQNLPAGPDRTSPPVA